MNKSELNVKVLTWDDVKDDIRNANPELADILEQFKPKYNFIKARYRYGDRILNQGVVHLPITDGSTVNLDSKVVPENIRKMLSYCYLPLALILKKSVEVFFEIEDRVMPSKLYTAGTTFGLWEVFDPTPSEFVRKVWNLSAGARTIFMLPKIADAIAHARLKRDYGISSYPPKKILDQNNVFIDLAHHIKAESTWDCEVLFFGNEWLGMREDNLSCVRLHNYWITEAWKQSYSCRNQMSYDVAWESFSREVTRRNWKPRAYIINTIKHLIAIGEGLFPGFAPACDDTSAPISLIQPAYVNTYLLKQTPIIFHPCHLKSVDNPVYYSLSLPTLLEYAPHSHNPRSIMGDMRELKNLMGVLLSSTKIHPISYEFFHSDEDRFAEIKKSSEMLEGDKNLLSYSTKYQGLKFADNSPFFHGCVRISRKK